MEFSLSEEQTALQEMAREFLRARWPAERMRAALDAQPAVIDEEVWSEIVQMGWLGVAASEEVGGIGGDVTTAAVLAQEAGRGILAGPFESSLVAAIALERSGDRDLCGDLLSGLIAGRTRATLAIDEPGGGYGIDAVETAIEARPEGWRISGRKFLVPDAEGASVLLVAARSPDGLGLVPIDANAPGVSIVPMRRLDGQSCAEVVFERAACRGASLLAGGEAVLREVYEIWTTLLAADLLGSAEASLELARQYASERVQFGRPIGSFQAVSHRLANEFVGVEIGRSLLWGACLALDEKHDHAPALVSAAKAWLSDTAVSAAESALQIHGGVGFTWEYDVHLHLRRARCNAALLGDADHHRDRVAMHMQTAWMPPVKA